MKKADFTKLKIPKKINENSYNDNFCVVVIRGKQGDLYKRKKIIIGVSYTFKEWQELKIH